MIIPLRPAEPYEGPAYALRGRKDPQATAKTLMQLVNQHARRHDKDAHARLVDKQTRVLIEGADAKQYADRATEILSGYGARNVRFDVEILESVYRETTNT